MEKKDEEKKIKWYYIINRPRCALINSIMLDGITRRFENKIPVDYVEKNVCVIRGIWYSDENDDIRIKSEIMAQLEKDDDFLVRLIHAQETKWISFERYLAKLKKSDFKKKSISDLKKDFDKITRFLVKWNSICLWLLWLPEKPLEHELMRMLEQKLSKKEAKEAFLLLTTPAKDGFFEQEKASLTKIAKLIKSKKSYVALFDTELDEIEKSIAKQPIIKKEIAKHLAEFSWLSNTDFKSIFWTEKTIIERVKYVLDKNALDEMLRTSVIKKEKEANIKQLISRLKPSKHDISLIRTARELVYFRTFRTDIQWKTGYYAQPLFQEIARRLKLSFENFHELFYSEISASLKKRSLDKRFIIKKNTLYAILVDRGVMTQYYGEADITRLEKKFKTDVDIEVTELKGTIANSGLAYERVRLVNTTKDISKVETGDVIVTLMTKPNYITAMEKAVAFVTDEGGLTCHAAIIARELGKPCIVGTKIATKVLKDGDYVEVDANKGIVRKLK